MSKSTVQRPHCKPPKPYEGFPLTAHASGQWSKKIRGKLYYFGVWADPQGALERLNRDYPHLKEGRTPPVADVSDGCSLKVLAKEFLRSKEDKLNAGDLSPRTFRDYFKTFEGLIGHFGKDRLVSDLTPADFRSYRAKLVKRFNVTSLKNEINRCRICFNYAHENQLIEKPVAYGSNFDRPSAKALRKIRNEAGPKLFAREEILRFLDSADTQLRAMILLGINCGFGNSDVASLPEKAVDLNSGWVEFPRPKTEIPRRIPLWKETTEAVRKWIEERPNKNREPEARGLLFFTQRGRPWVRVHLKQELSEGEKEGPQAAVPIDSLSSEFGKLLKRLKINGRRGLGFYTLRHCFETYAGESRDQVAVNACMGHVDNSMAATYRHGVSDERLLAVVDAVRTWLFDDSENA